MGVVIGHPADLIGEAALKVESHDLPLIDDCRALVVDGAARGQELLVSFCTSLRGVAHRGAGDSRDEEEG